jgi:two-component system, NarL family, invasion response regulator UvrY
MALASVLLVEDDVFTRSTLAAALSGANFEIKGEVSTAKDALAAIQKFSIDIAVLDLDLGPGANGIDIAYALRQLHPQIGIIILTSYSDPRVANPDSLPLPKGSKFITKSKLTDIRPLIKAIIELKHLPISGRTISETERSIFTENQLIVLQGVAEGLTTKEIAKRLKVSDKAIEGTITRLHTLLDLPKDASLNPRVQLARAYFELAGKKPPGV